MTAPLAYSVIICTHNRATILAECLVSVLAEAAAVPTPGEILVIDNGSTDQTRQVVTTQRDTSGGDTVPRYIFEPLPGLAHARNRGLDEAKGGIIIFIDDDTIVHSGWLKSCLDGFAERPDAASLGGPILPRSALGLPSWFQSPLSKVYSVMTLGFPDEKLHPYPGEEHPLGANMAFRRDVFSQTRFSPRLGRTSGNLMGSEETRIFFDLRREGRAILYVPRMGVDHDISPDRLAEEWVVRRYWFDGVCRARLELGWRLWMRDAVLMALKLAWLGVAWHVRRSPFERLLCRCRLAKSLGFFAEATGCGRHPRATAKCS